MLRPSGGDDGDARAGAHDIVVGDMVFGAAWSYPDPAPECRRVAGLIAFLNEKVDLILDGVPQRRPATPWSL